MNTKSRDRNLDMPGPGEYDMNVYPSNQSNIAHWIGSDYRKDMSIPKAEHYPGPQSYYPNTEEYTGPAISFTREKKKNKVEKTYAPGPLSYQPLDTVGIIHGYNREERYPRQQYNAPLRK